MGTSYGHLGQVDRGLRYLRKALRQAKEAVDRPEACRGSVNQINILEDAGRIGQALFIAERTVAVQVSRILEKLGLRSRSQVAGLLRG